MLSPNPVPSRQPLQQWKAASEVDSEKQISDPKKSSFHSLVEQKSSDFEDPPIADGETDLHVVDNDSTDQGFFDGLPEGTSALKDEPENLEPLIINPDSALDTDWQFNETVISSGQSESTLEISSIDFDQSQTQAELDESSDPIILNFKEHSILAQASVDQSNRTTDPTLDSLDGEGAEPRLIYPINQELTEAEGDTEILDSNASDDTLLGDVFPDTNSEDSNLLNQRNSSFEIPDLEGAPAAPVDSSFAKISDSAIVEPAAQIVSQAWIQPGSQSPITSGMATQFTTDHLQPANGSVAAQQLSESLVREVTFDSSKAEKKMTLYLHPAELGRLTVEIGWESETISASIVASEKATSEMLDRDRQWLMDHLANSGVELTSFDVSHEGTEPDRESEQTFEFAAESSSVDPNSDRRDPIEQAIGSLNQDGGRARLNIVA